MAGPAARALQAAVPALYDRLPWIGLGTWPTPIERVRDEIWVKREDLTAPTYGGNKVRTLEAMFGRARAAGATRIWATGAYGSNHVLATVIHAAQAGLEAGALLFPQPPSEPALANAGAIVAAAPAIVTLPSVAMLPAAMALIARRAGAYVMAPGGASAEGAMGALAAAFELAAQCGRGGAPWPLAIVVPVGSGCTTAGLLAGLHLAHALGHAPPPPAVHAVRVTPWPITSRWRLARLAAHAIALCEAQLGRSSGVGFAALQASLTVDGRFLGAGYGHMTATGEAAATELAHHGLHADPVYAAKAAAALFELAPRAPGPVLLWLTKSSAPLARATDDQIARAPARLRHWLGRGA